MQVQDIERLLVELDQALIDLGIQTAIPLLLLGGAYIMVEKIVARRTTRDIDVFPFIISETDQATGMPLSVALYQAALAVAQKKQLSSYWFNTVRVGALEPLCVARQRTLWKKYQILEVYLPEKEYVLVQKLLINRRKDRQDIIGLFQALGIGDSTQAQTLMDRYLSPTEQQQRGISQLLRSF